jgi:bifunctional DNA-binding transcriptional regulator/antitoxin component of YhaV-PrlF toxin-antitoxin module
MSKIEFTRAVDRQGRLVIPQDIRDAMGIDNRKTLVKFTAEKVQYLDENEDEDQEGDS